MVEEFFKSISIVFYEALCCGIFLNMFLEQRYPARWLKSLSVFLLTGVFLFWALITQTGGHYVFRSIGIIISIALFAVIFYTGKWLLKIFLSFIFYAILFCVDYLGLILVDLLLDSADLSNSVIQVILVLLCKTVLFVIVLILDYFWKREKELDVKKSEWILMISFPMMTVVIMLVMLLSFQQKNNSFGYLTVSFGMVSINLVMFVLLKYISAREKQYINPFRRRTVKLLICMRNFMKRTGNRSQRYRRKQRTGSRPAGNWNRIFSPSRKIPSTRWNRKATVWMIWNRQRNCP